MADTGECHIRKKKAILIYLCLTPFPRSDIEELAGWIAFLGRDPGFQPRSGRLWHLYSVRSTLRPNKTQVEKLIRFNLLGEVPVFYWLRNMDAEAIKKLLLNTLEDARSIAIKADILHVGAFIGKGFYNRFLGKLQKHMEKLGPRSRKYPDQGPREFFHPYVIESGRKIKCSKDDTKYQKELKDELTAIAKDFSEEHGDHYMRFRARSIDCFLYARDDMYKKDPKTKD